MTHKLKSTVLKLWDTPKYYWPLLALTFVVTRLGTWIYPFDSDHWIFFYVGKNWFHGGSLYVTAWDHKPPVIFLINGLMSLISDNIVVHRILITGFALLDIYLFYLLARVLAKKLLPSPLPVIPAEAGIQGKNQDGSLGLRPGMTKRGLADSFTKLSLFIYVLWRNLSPFTSSGNNNENFGLIFYIGMLLGYFSFREDRKWWKLALSGVCFSVLFFMKGNFLLLAAPVGIMLLVDYYKELQKFFGYALAFGLPLIVMAGAWVSYFASKGTLGEFVLATFTFSAKYSTSAWKGDLSNMNVFYILVAFASPLIIMVPLFYWAWAWQSRKSHEYLFFSLTLLFGSIAFFAVGVPYLYYFLILMPVYALVATYLLLNGAKYHKYVYFVFAITFVFGMMINLAYSTYQTYRNQVSHTITEAKEYRDIAAYVAANSSPSDKVFTADYGATFYELAHRDSGSRFISASVLLLDYRDGYGFGLDDKFISDMEKSKAKYVVAYKDRNSLYYQNKPVVQYFDSHYVLDKTFTTFVVLKRNKK